MKRIEEYLNVLHFCLYKADYKLHLLSNKINLFHLIHKLPFQKRRYEKLGIDPIETINQVYKNKNYGTSMVFAGGILWGGIAIFFFSLLILFNVFVYATMPYIIACAVLSGALCYFFVFKNDKYIQYFDKYEKWSKAEIKKYRLLTLVSIIAIILLFYLGLKT